MSEIKITGMGLVCSLGGSVEETYRAMCAGGDGFRELTRFDAAPYARRNGGQVDDALEQSIRDEWPDDDWTVGMMKRAGSEACSQACIDRVPSPRRGLVLATNFGPMETLEWAWRERMDTGVLDAESYAPVAGVLDAVGEFFGCGGPRQQLSMSCASGAAAADAACDLLESGRADEVLVLAYDALTEYGWCGLSNLRTITTERLRPFDAGRSGTVFSEGAAAMVLCGAAGAGTALAWLSGSATNNNAFHMTAPCKEADGSRRVMAAALRKAGLSPSDITHVCAHATGTHANDETESAAFRNLFGERLSGMTVSAHKSQLGHMLGAAGLAEAIITVCAMNSGVIPPTIGLRERDASCAPVDCCAGRARVASFDAAVTDSAGIGGNNASLVLTRRRCPGGPVRRAVETLYVRGMSWVLPSSVGSGSALRSHPEWLTPGEGLSDFRVKSYLSSVKGYLDPGSAYLLAAFSLLCPPEGGTMRNERLGVSTWTQYGSCSSAYVFFEQLVQKGARFASPMIFPHSYASAPGNLAAMELGCAGPHRVLSGRQEPAGALWYAAERFADGSADEMLVGAYEAPISAALPDGLEVLRGAVAFRVSPTPSPDDVAAWPLPRLSSVRSSGDAGAVQSLASLVLG